MIIGNVFTKRDIINNNMMMLFISVNNHGSSFSTGFGFADQP